MQRGVTVPNHLNCPECTVSKCTLPVSSTWLELQWKNVFFFPLTWSFELWIQVVRRTVLIFFFFPSWPVSFMTSSWTPASSSSDTMTAPLCAANSLPTWFLFPFKSRRTMSWNPISLFCHSSVCLCCSLLSAEWSLPPGESDLILSQQLNRFWC